MYRLLIVDDERYLVESIYELISAQSELDLDILTCCYSDEAMQIINSQRIDLILLDSIKHIDLPNNRYLNSNIMREH